MLDKPYTKLIQKLPYKPLILVPLLISGLFIILISTLGIPMSLDFQGGTWIEVTLNQPIQEGKVNELSSSLKNENLENLKIYSGRDLETGNSKLTLVTTTLLNETHLKPLLERWLGEELRTEDFVSAKLEKEIKKPDELKQKLENIYQNTEIKIDRDEITFRGLDLDKDKIGKNLGYYLNITLKEESISYQERNLIVDQIDPLLGRAFWTQGIKAVLIAFLLMIFIIFLAFRDFVPSVAVILAATCDAIIAAGGMSIFGIPLEPASLIALLMLIGYSVDSDVMLTTRVLRSRFGEVNERIDDAMKTGLTMTLTTLAVMLVVMVASNTLIGMGLNQMTALASIASVLFLGLVGDLATTWFMNAGILKWYVEEKGGKFSILKRKKRWR